MTPRGYIALLATALTLSAQETPVALQVRVVEGEGVIYPVGSRSARGVTIAVVDAAGKPVSGATVSFLLPDQGSTGIFASGSRTEIATTNADGQASAWGMRWNRVAGPVAIKITAVKGALRGSASCNVTLTTALSTATPATSAPSHGGSSHKWLWIALIVGAGAGGAVAAGGLGGKSTNTAAPPPAVTITTIGAPTINIGRP